MLAGVASTYMNWSDISTFVAPAVAEGSPLGSAPIASTILHQPWALAE
jgi:hypothetical protein